MIIYEKVDFLGMAVIMIAVLLTGCTGEEKTLYDALFEKQYNSSKTSSTINYKISGEGFTEDEFPTFLNNFGLSWIMS